MKFCRRLNSYKVITSFLSLKHKNMMVNSLSSRAKLRGIKSTNCDLKRDI